MVLELHIFYEYGTQQDKNAWNLVYIACNRKKSLSDNFIISPIMFCNISIPYLSSVCDILTKILISLPKACGLTPLHTVTYSTADGGVLRWCSEKHFYSAAVSIARTPCIPIFLYTAIPTMLCGNALKLEVSRLLEVLVTGTGRGCNRLRFL